MKAMLFFIICAGAAFTCATAQVNWDPYAPTTHSLTLPDGDYVEVTVQGLSHIMLINEGTWWDYSRWPFVKVSALTVWGHYSNKREPYVITGQVIPGSGPEGGWFRINSLNIYTYHRCDGDQPWMNYVATNALPIWKPEQTGELKVTGSGGYLPDCPVHHELTKIEFRGSDGSGVVREIYIDLKGGRSVPPAPPDDPGDPDYEFTLDYDGREPRPPGDDWPPPDDDHPPYGDDADPLDTMPPPGDGPGKCSPFGLPVYRVNASDLSLDITDRMFAYASLGPNLSFTHTHRSRKASDGMLGSRWYFSYEQKVVPLFPSRVRRGGLELSTWINSNATPPAANVHLGHGRPTKFTYTGTNATGEKVYASEDPYLKAELVLLPDAWELRRQKPRLTHRFERVPSFITYPLGRLSSIADPFGNEVMFTYESNTNGSERAFWLIGDITDAVGRGTTFDYTNGLCSRITMPNGLFASFVYDSNACLMATTDLLGNIINYTYNETVHTLTDMESAGSAVRFVYASDRRLAELVNPLGYTNSYLTIASNVTRFTSAAGYTMTTALNERGLPAAQTNALGDAAAMSYAAEGLPLEVMTPRGYRVGVVYDEARNLIRHENAAGAVTTRGFDERHRLVAITNALGQVTHYTYGPNDELHAVVLPSGAATRYGYNAQGQITAVTNPVGGVTRYQYDGFGNLTRITDPLGGVTTFSYDAYGLNRVALTNALGQATRYTFDANGRRTRLDFADGSYQQFMYDCCAQTGWVDEIGRMVAVERDDRLQVTNAMAPDGSVMATRHDADGREIEQEDDMGRAMITLYDGAGRAMAVETPMGRVGAAFDEVWNIVAFTNPAGERWTFSYDADNRLIQRTDPRGRSVAFGRDALGRMVASTNSRGQVVSRAYTADGYLATVATPDVGACQFNYNAAGWPTNHSTPAGTCGYAYDLAGNVVQIDYPNALSVHKTYDALGRESAITYPGGLEVNYHYDARGRMTNVAWAGDAVSFVYDAAGRPLSIARASGANTFFAWDIMDGLTNLSHTCASGALVNIRFTLDGAGRVTRKNIDSLYIPAVATFGTEVNQFSYDVTDQMTAWDGVSVQHDADGNITNLPALGMRMQYDSLNRLVYWSAPGSTNQATYDSLGRMWVRQSASETERYHYDEAGRLLFATDGAGALLWRLVYAGEQVLARVASTGVRYYHFDDLGHTLATTDSGGAIIDVFAYTPYGKAEQHGGAEREPFTLSGRDGVVDVGEGLYRMAYRMYQADAARFLQSDPAGLLGGFNMYAYVMGDPANQTDPLGLRGGRSRGANPSRSLSRAQRGLQWQLSPTARDRYISDAMRRYRGSSVCLTTDIGETSIGVTKYGIWYSVGKIAYKIQQGEYVEALQETGSTAIGVASSTAGALWNFVFTPTQMGNANRYTEEEYNTKKREYFNTLGPN
ncbi:MAG: RHS repeat protein [Spartobacteria bacterium]|nr:RHS repeat protein [Spartobacteria bacterium]